MASANSSDNRPGQRVYSRRTGRPLSPARKAALAKLPALKIQRDAAREDGMLDPATLFPKQPAQLWLEFGFGSGEHLLARLAQNPTHAYIGIEPYINGLSAFLYNLDDKDSARIRLFDDDGMTLVRSLKPASLDGFYLLNPDPWPKKKHHRRRTVNAENLDQIARVLKPGGTFIMTTDVDELAEWMVAHTVNHKDFEWTAKSKADWQTPPADWPLTTRYMQKGLHAGRKETYLVFIKRDNPNHYPRSRHPREGGDPVK